MIYYTFDVEPENLSEANLAGWNEALWPIPFTVGADSKEDAIKRVKESVRLWGIDIPITLDLRFVNGHEEAAEGGFRVVRCE